MKLLSPRPALLMVAVMLSLLASSPPVRGEAFSSAPTITGPADGATLTSMGTTLTWTNPAGVTWYHIQVTAYNGQGPGTNLIIGDPTLVAAAQYQVRAPQMGVGNYVMLPGMTYTWRVRVTDKPTQPVVEDPSWGQWAERRFRTPVVTSASISPLTPVTGDVVSTLLPTLQWINSRSDVWWYEVQMSKDSTFNTDPATATAAVYWELRHAGTTSPLNGYAVPASYPLEDNTNYYWRVRPRVQGDGSELSWSTTYIFQTNTRDAPLLTAGTIAFGPGGANPFTCQMVGATSSFLSEPTLTGVYYGYPYSGSGTIVHNWYLDNKPLLPTAYSRSAPSGCGSASLGTPGGGPDAGSPLPPGAWRMEVWYAGKSIQSGSFTITPAAAPAIGAITVGTDLASSVGCRLSGVGTSFFRGIPILYFRFNTVGSGTYSLTVYQGTTPRATATTPLTSPVDCETRFYTPTGGYGAGTWRFEVSLGGQVVQSVTFVLL